MKPFVLNNMEFIILNIELGLRNKYLTFQTLLRSDAVT